MLARKVGVIRPGPAAVEAGPGHLGESMVDAQRRMLGRALHRAAVVGIEVRRLLSGPRPLIVGDIGHDQPAPAQNDTASPPLRSSICRASLGVATSSDRFSRMVRMRETCSALLLASAPLPI